MKPAITIFSRAALTTDSSATPKGMPTSAGSRKRASRPGLRRISPRTIHRPCSPLTTDSNGNYLFTNLKPGTYSVQFDKATLPAGYSFTTKDSGADATDSDANPADGKTIQTVLDSGESDKTWDAGIVANPTEGPNDEPAKKVTDTAGEWGSGGECGEARGADRR